MIQVTVDQTRCNGCNVCVEFCPTSVFDLVGQNGTRAAAASRPEACWGCMTCVGKCPEWAISVSQAVPPKRYADAENDKPFVPLNAKERDFYASASETLERTLGLRWKPVAVTLIPKGDPMPHVPVPRVRLRYCQSLIMARRGKSILMPPTAHSCPDGTSILGLSKVPQKLASGDIYVQFGKVANKEAAMRLVRERPVLPEESIGATLVTPLDRTVMKPDVVAIMAPPETMMWLCMSSTYYTGSRSSFKMGSYNAQCVETTVYPYTTGEINMSLGCYGCRAISDLGDDCMFMGIPTGKLPLIIDGLRHLAKKAIPDARSRIYLPPMI